MGDESESIIPLLGKAIRLRVTLAFRRVFDRNEKNAGEILRLEAQTNEVLKRLDLKLMGKARNVRKVKARNVRNHKVRNVRHSEGPHEQLRVKIRVKIEGSKKTIVKKASQRRRSKARRSKPR